MLTHQNIVANIVQNRPRWDLMERKDEVKRPVIISVLPWYHIY